MFVHRTMSCVGCLCYRVTINRYGQFSYKHRADSSWDVSEWLLETRNHLTTWSDVYWYIWGTVNHLDCSRCLETFPCTEFSNCRYHPEPAVFEPNRLTGEHPCCGLKVQRFDPLQPNKVSSESNSVQFSELLNCSRSM